MKLLAVSSSKDVVAPNGFSVTGASNVLRRNFILELSDGPCKYIYLCFDMPEDTKVVSLKILTFLNDISPLTDGKPITWRELAHPGCKPVIEEIQDLIGDSNLAMIFMDLMQMLSDVVQ